MKDTVRAQSLMVHKGDLLRSRIQGVSIEIFSEGVKQLILSMGQSVVSVAREGRRALTLSRMIEAFPLARTYAAVMIKRSPVAKGGEGYISPQ
jgi:hypothetical protein